MAVESTALAHLGARFDATPARFHDLPPLDPSIPRSPDRPTARTRPHQGSSAPERVAQVGFALLLGGIYAALGAGPLENALSGVACVALATVRRATSSSSGAELTVTLLL